uniref:Uncharacterized protein n=1 Tax=Pertusaria plittiana TaxID=394545 RepID=A0A2P1M548_9LECA|nr:hypothetical protein [Pertusaria plittiana]
MILKYMINYTKKNFQAHAFHLVSPSPLPLFTCVTPLNIIQSKPNVYNFKKNSINFSTTRICYAGSDDPLKSVSNSLDTLKNTMAKFEQSKMESLIKERIDFDKRMHDSNTQRSSYFDNLDNYFSEEFMSKFSKDNEQYAEVINKFIDKLENLAKSGTNETEYYNTENTMRKLMFNFYYKQSDDFCTEINRVTEDKLNPEQKSNIINFLSVDKEKITNLSKENDAFIAREKNLMGSNEWGFSSFTAANCPLEKGDSSILMDVFRDIKQSLKTIIPYELLFILQAILVIYRIYILLKKVYKWLSK